MLAYEERSNMNEGIINFINELTVDTLAEILWESGLNCSDCPARGFCKELYKKYEDICRPYVPEYRDKPEYEGETDEEILQDLVCNYSINTSHCHHALLEYFKSGKEVVIHAKEEEKTENSDTQVC